MEKLIYLIECGIERGAEPGRENQPPLSSVRVLECAKKELQHHCAKLTVNVWEGAEDVRALAERYSTADEERQLLASVSIWLECLDQRDAFEAALDTLTLPYHGYLVTESMVVDYRDRDWPVGEKSPGVTLVAAFRRPPRLSEREFYRRWQEGHSRLALEIHPFSRYIRNAVARVLEPTSPEFSAIVEERTASVEEMAPGVFFSGRDQEASDDLASFVDVGGFDQMRIELMSEYIIRD